MNIFGMVTTRNSWEYTSYALKSFFRNTKLSGDDRLYLIDNDDAFEEEASWFSPHLEIIKNSSMQSFSVNMNHLMSVAREKQADFFILHNDIIFTDSWLPPLLNDEEAITSVLSNANTDYDIPGLDWKVTLKLNEYLGREAKLKELVKQHQAKADGYKTVLSLPFFCVRIPFRVYAKTGMLDDSFQAAGFEDFDYCLRAYAEGFRVQYAKHSLVLHFGGKSTWAGGEQPEQTKARTDHNREKFSAKWGDLLTTLVLEMNESPIKDNPEHAALYNDARFAELISALAHSR